jgi:hypothetical protein
MEEFSRWIGITVVAGYALALTPFLLLSLAIPYAVLRLRAPEGTEPDPQVGLKVFLYYFFSVSVLLGLTGVTTIAVDIVLKKEQPEPARGGPFGVPQRPALKSGTFDPVERTGSALVVVGVLFALFHWVLAKVATNDRRWPAARRLFAGWRLAVHGLVLLGTATTLMITLFQEETNIETVKVTLTVGFIWSLAWITDLIVLYLYSRPVRAVERLRRAPRDLAEDDD